MSEQPRSKPNLNPIFETAPEQRPICKADVETIQRYLAEVSEAGVSEGMSFTFSEQGLYEALTEGNTDVDTEPRAQADSFDKPMSVLLDTWAKMKNIPDAAPDTFDGIKALFSKYPNLNDRAPIEFQGGDPYAEEGRFIHVMPGRALGIPRQGVRDVRTYLNPSADKMGYVVEQLTGAALSARVPLYFKFVDVASGSPSRRALEREDRIVIYSPESQVAFLDDTLSKIVNSTPDAFEGRRVAGFGEKLADGVVRAAGVTDEQNRKFGSSTSGKTSFNALRAKLLFDVTLRVAKDIICSDANATLRVNSQTIREKFASELTGAIASSSMPDSNKTVVTENDSALLQVIGAGLSSEALKQIGYGDKAVAAIEKAVLTTARDILPKLRSNDLLVGYEHYIHRLAPSYGIDPNNLAKNIPIAN